MKRTTAAKKNATKKAPAKQAGAKKAPAKQAGAKKAPAKKPMKKAATKGVVLLSGGNPQIAMGEGDGPVQAYIAGIPGWKQDVARRLDALIGKTVKGVQKAVKWNSPFYGVEPGRWFVSFHVFTNYVKVTFFDGTSLRPAPPVPSKHPTTRYVDVREGALDEAQMASWLAQAAALPGWRSNKA